MELLPDLWFYTFKFLDSIDFIYLKRTCKQFNQLVKTLYPKPHIRYDSGTTLLIKEEYVNITSTILSWASLYEVARNGPPCAVSILLKYIPQGINHSYGLRSAALGGKLENIKLILKYCKPEHITGGLATYEACIGGNVEIVKMFIKPNSDIWSGFLRACNFGHYELTKWFIEEKGVTWVDDGLGHACTYGRWNVAQLLMEKGANDMLKGLRGACHFGNMETIDFFVKKLEVQPNPNWSSRRWAYTYC